MLSRYLRYLLMVAIVLTTASCASGPDFPSELKLRRVSHETSDVQWMGPGGLSQSFTVYELRQDVVRTLAERGLHFLTSLPSINEEKNRELNEKKESGRPYWAPFVDWKATPVQGEGWRRRDRVKMESIGPSIRTFYARFEKPDEPVDSFIEKIPTELRAQFQEAISTPGSFYAYGFYRDICLVVVSPKLGKAFYLFRD